MQINDGTGGGYSAKVSENGRVAVDADDGALAAAKAGTLYSMSMTGTSQPTVTVTSGGGVVMLLQNAVGSRNSLVIDSVLVSGSAAGMHASLVMNSVVGTLGQKFDLEIASTNTAYPTGSSATATGTVWNDGTGDGITGLTGGNTVLVTQLSAGGSVEMVDSGRFVVAPGGTIGVGMRLAGEGTVAIRFYEIDEHKGY